MRVARAPLRISLGGGGTDLPHYRDKYGGYVISQAIQSYVYVTVNPRYDGRIRIATSIDQTVDTPDKIAHPIVREFFRIYKPTGGWDIHSSADVDGSSGLGSSGAFTVALMTAFLGYPHNRQERAEEAYMLESGISECGPQDHYAAAYGECHAFTFPAAHHNDSAHPVKLDSSNLLNALLLYDTGIRRQADASLKEVRKSDPRHLHSIKRDGELLGNRMKEGRGKVYLPSLMRDHWAAKCQTQTIPPAITRMWEKGMGAGARAGKLVGAGGGGFMLFYVDVETQPDVKKAMKAYREVPLKPALGVTYWEI